MKAIQALGWYFPQSVGGTEVYVASLIAQLRKVGVNSVVTAPNDAHDEQFATHEMTNVYRYPTSGPRTRAQLRGSAPHSGFDKFEHWLDRQDATIYHQHSWTYGCGLHHLRAAQRRGMRTVLTVHVPGPICLRGTMLRDGLRPCDGLIREDACASCWLQKQGMPAWPRAFISRIPPAAAGVLRPLGRAGTALAATALVRDHRRQLLDAAATADHVVAVCGWLYDALLLNGVPRAKLSLNRQGVSHATDPAARQNRPVRGSHAPLVVGFLGRWDPIKGAGLIVEAMLRLPPGCRVELRLHAVESQDPEMIAHMKSVCERAAPCGAIHIGPAISPAAVPDFLNSIDVLAVPSQWLETGPLVVLEAFAAGTPVLGSNLGGIRELVSDGRNGRLLPHDQPQAWADALQELADSRETLLAWRDGIAPVRTMRDVALEMQQLYASLLDSDAEVRRP